MCLTELKKNVAMKWGRDTYVGILLECLYVFVRCGCRVSAGTIPAEEQGESHEGSKSKTVQHEARGRDQQTLQPAQNPGEMDM